MAIFQKQFGIVEAIANLPTGGTIALTGTNRAEMLRGLTINQTTAGQTAVIPNPVDTSVVFGIDVMNIGSASISMYGVTLTPNSMGRFGWDGDSWNADVAPNASNETIENLTPTAQNVVPDLANTPAAGTTVKFFVNGEWVYNAGVTSDAAGSITVVPATLGYNVETVDIVTAVYAT